MEKDSAQFSLSELIDPIIKGQNDESVTYFYYRPEEFEWGDVSLLSSFNAHDLQIIWGKYKQQLITIGREEKIKEIYEDFQSLLPDVHKNILENKTLAHVKELNINENAFDELGIVNRVTDANADLDSTYSLLVEAIEINPYSIPLLKAYCFTSIQMGLSEYADSGYMRLMELLSTQEMNTFAVSYYDAQQLQKSQASAWK